MAQRIFDSAVSAHDARQLGMQAGGWIGCMSNGMEAIRFPDNSALLFATFDIVMVCKAN
jgi:hypothetical protein